MQRLEFKHLLAQIAMLSAGQRASLVQSLQTEARGAQVVQLIESARRPLLACPRCDGQRYRRHGCANGLQRFRCVDCARTFNSLSGTPMARLRLKPKWLDYSAESLDPATTVRRAAERVGVHKNTSFRWRHRQLEWTRLDRPPPLDGIVEADEMYILESQKGARTLDRPARRRGGVAGKRGISSEQVCILVARSRSGQTHDAVTGRGALTAARLHRHLAPVLHSHALLVTDGHPAYPVFARQAGISHEAVNLQAGVRVRGAIHVQNVNAYHSRLRQWLHHFLGVATRYLPNYLGWRWAIDGGRIATPAAMLRRAIGVFGAE